MTTRKRPSNNLPAKVDVVTGEGRMTDKGYRYENHDWAPYLIRYHKGKWNGLDPKRVPAEILRASGHPPKPATNRIKAYFKWLRGVDIDKMRDRGLKRLRQLCIDCSAGSKAEVARCPCIDCPLWAHRMGYNPHTFHNNRAKRTAHARASVSTK